MIYLQYLVFSQEYLPLAIFKFDEFTILGLHSIYLSRFTSSRVLYEDALGWLGEKHLLMYKIVVEVSAPSTYGHYFIWKRRCPKYPKTISKFNIDLNKIV